MIRAVIDLNVIISAMISTLGIPYQVWSAWLLDERYSLAISEGMIVELAGKLATPRIARRSGMSLADISAITNMLAVFGARVEVPAGAVPVVTGDPEDDLVLETARLGRADYLVTGDRGLLDLGQHHGVAIVTPRDFLAVLDASE